MKRTQQNKRPDLILMSDGHMRETHPPCRVDDFVNDTQWKSWDFISDLQEKYNCEVINAGDLFHHWKPSPWLLSQAILHLPDDLVTIYGQHDLPQHNMNLAHKSGIRTLWEANKIELLEHTHFGEELKESSYTKEDYGWEIAVWHNFTWDGKKVPWPGCNEMTAEEVLDEYPQFDLIVTGDYHKGFTYRKDGRLLVNPGCLTRQVADYKDYRPRVYLWYAEDNTVEPVYLPIEKDAVSREHIEVQENHDRRITAFIERLSGEWETTVSFEKNMDRFLKTNDVPKQIKEIIYKATE